MSQHYPLLNLLFTRVNAIAGVKCTKPTLHLTFHSHVKSVCRKTYVLGETMPPKWVTARLKWKVKCGGNERFNAKRNHTRHTNSISHSLRMHLLGPKTAANEHVTFLMYRDCRLAFTIMSAERLYQCSTHSWGKKVSTIKWVLLSSHFWMQQQHQQSEPRKSM